MSVNAPGTDIVCLLGPTASGKTAAALEAARRRAARGQAVEIISVDSALVYRDMDIGTAKPTAAERAGVPHHLIDIREPTEAYSAADFRDDTLRLSAAILARGAQPLLVGGTMLYYRALTQGLAALPAADPVVRAALDAEAAAHGWPALHARLARHDPHTAARLAPNDAQRIQRALEVWQLTGETLSALLAKPVPERETGVDAPLSGSHPYRFVPVSLEPSDRAVLHARIEARFDAMLDGGLVDEVRRLRARGDLSATLPAMRCVGYRQVWEYLDGPDSPGAWRTMRDKGIFATRQLCKRQLTWLRGFTGRRVVDCSAPDTVARAADAIEALWDDGYRPTGERRDARRD